MILLSIYSFCPPDHLITVLQQSGRFGEELKRAGYYFMMVVTAFWWSTAVRHHSR